MEDFKTQNILRDLNDERLETERLNILPVSLDYAQHMLTELTTEITKYLSFNAPQSIEEEINFVNQSREKMQRGTDLALVILDKKTKEYLGGVGIRNLKTKSPELGVWVKKSAHGRKIGREAVARVQQWAQDNLNFDYFVYHVHKDNISSRKLAESLGGVVISSKKRLHLSGKQMDTVVYYIPKKQSSI